MTKNQPKIDQKSTENRSQDAIHFSNVFSSIFHRFLIDSWGSFFHANVRFPKGKRTFAIRALHQDVIPFPSILVSSCVDFWPQKSIKIDKKSIPKRPQNLFRFWDRFWTVFGSILGPKMGLCWGIFRVKSAPGGLPGRRPGAAGAPPEQACFRTPPGTLPDASRATPGRLPGGPRALPGHSRQTQTPIICLHSSSSHYTNCD